MSLLLIAICPSRHLEGLYVRALGIQSEPDKPLEGLVRWYCSSVRGYYRSNMYYYDEDESRFDCPGYVDNKVLEFPAKIVEAVQYLRNLGAR